MISTTRMTHFFKLKIKLKTNDKPQKQRKKKTTKKSKRIKHIKECEKRITKTMLHICTIDDRMSIYTHVWICTDTVVIF